MEMARKIEHLWVQVAGLCMIVQHEQKVHILMPAMKHHDHTHCPFIHVSKRFSTRDTLAPISQRAIDIPVNTRGAEQRLAGLLHCSKATDKSAVKSKYLQANPAFGDLEARVTLPLSTAPLKALGPTATLTLKYDDGAQDYVESHGRIGVKLDVIDGPDRLEIPGTGVTLVPDDKGNVEITLLNVRAKDLGKPPEVVLPNEHLHHLDAYWPLLELNGKKPPMVHAPLSGAPGDPKKPGDVKCGDATYVDFPRWGAEHPDGEAFGGANPGMMTTMSIDPFQCTVGGGCPNGDC